ncbi:molybdate-anion transporter-like [Olea europaea var. sylvestris]|uniref:molybdate-anion transporter-like n=1 Tax=Olea europaea var. sylvestris TaxID=158386 RepID=UPI000C1D69C7|nr:molybdate-anion transporter-like [Olea europaea var. sylvestris]
MECNDGGTDYTATGRTSMVRLKNHSYWRGSVLTGNQAVNSCIALCALKLTQWLHDSSIHMNLEIISDQEAGTRWSEKQAKQRQVIQPQFSGFKYGRHWSDEKIALLGAIQSLFEGSMYTFVFLWTPALSPNDEDIPHGFIFATFMLASMLGSSIASRLLSRNSPKVESYMQIVFIISSASLLLPILTSFLVAPSKVKGGGISFSGCLQLLGFSTFEACVGIFWPSIMKMRSQYVPEEARSTIMNFFRIPLNMFVCIVLYNVDAFPITVMFGMCSIFLFVASILQRRLSAIADKPKTEDWAMMKDKDAEGEPLNVT